MVAINQSKAQAKCYRLICEALMSVTMQNSFDKVSEFLNGYGICLKDADADYISETMFNIYEQEHPDLSY